MKNEKERLDLISAKLDNKKKLLDIKEREKSLHDSDKKIIMDQINNLRYVIGTTLFDEEATLFPSEPKFKNALSPEEIKKVKTKILRLVDEL